MIIDTRTFKKINTFALPDFAHSPGRHQPSKEISTTTRLCKPVGLHRGYTEEASLRHYAFGSA